MSFVAEPTARTWYRAHNASIVSAYLEHRDVADAESRPERFFLNVVLLRVLYAHALVAAPRLALGGSRRSGPVLGDPRLSMTGIFLSLSRVLPARYPLGDEVATYVAAEQQLRPDARLRAHRTAAATALRVVGRRARRAGAPRLHSRRQPDVRLGLR